MQSIKMAIFFLFFGLVAQAREVITDHFQSDYEVRVNGVVFERHVDVTDGVRRIVYRVGGVDVLADAFEVALARAEAEDQLRNVRLESENLGAREREAQLTRALVTKKLLQQLIDHCRNDLVLLEKFTLERYFVFSPDTLTREAYEELVTKLIPEAVRLLAADAPVSEVTQLYRTLETYEKRVNAFVFSTIRHAIDQATDPKLLKDLLAVVS